MDHPSQQPDRRTEAGKLRRITQALENVAGDIDAGLGSDYHVFILRRLIAEVEQLETRDLFAYQQGLAAAEFAEVSA